MGSTGEGYIIDVDDKVYAATSGWGPIYNPCTLDEDD